MGTGSWSDKSTSMGDAGCHLAGRETENEAGSGLDEKLGFLPARRARNCSEELWTSAGCFFRSSNSARKLLAMASVLAPYFGISFLFSSITISVIDNLRSGFFARL